MSKNLVFAILGLIATIGVIVILLLNLTKKQNLISPIAKNKQETSQDTQVLSATQKEYIDPSGFKFKYPDNFSVSTAEQLAENVYSSLTLKSDDVKGKTEILVEATNAKSLDDWLNQNSKKIVKEKLQKIKLADMDAVQFEKDNKVVTNAFDTGGVLFTITTELKPNRDTMFKLNNMVISSFAFVQPEIPDASTQSSDGTEGEVYFEDEEIIE